MTSLSQGVSHKYLLLKDECIYLEVNMLAVAFFLVLAVYLVLSSFIAKQAARLARRFGWRGWSLAIPAFVVMLGLVFWDWIPMEVTYRYYCNNEAGFTQYKTIEQWREENPGVWERLTPAQDVKPIREDYYQRRPLNERFSWDTHWVHHGFKVVEIQESIVDMKTDSPIAVYVDFRTDFSPIGWGGSVRDLKFWMYKGRCEEKIITEMPEFNTVFSMIREGVGNGYN